MRVKIVLLLILGLIGNGYIMADDNQGNTEPKELALARTAFQNQMKAATAPVIQKYLQTLDTMKKQLGGKGDIAGATAIQKEIDSITKIGDKDLIDGDKTKGKTNTADNPKQDNCLVIWNQHNADYNDRGTKKINIVFFKGDKIVDKRENKTLKWEKGKDCKNSFPLPDKTFDKVRIEILEYVELGAGLSEIEIWKGGENIALKSKVSVSGITENKNEFSGDRLIDGITSSSTSGVGYWLSQNKTAGAWCKLELDNSN